MDHAGRGQSGMVQGSRRECVVGKPASLARNMNELLAGLWKGVKRALGRSVVAPGHEDGLAEDALVGFCEKDTGGALTAPGSVARVEYCRVRLDEFFLLNGCELDHAPIFIRIGERGEDFSGHTEVGMVHVLAFFGFGEAESDAAEIGWSARHIKVLTQAQYKGTGR